MHLVERLILYSTHGNDNIVYIIYTTGKGNRTCDDGSEQILLTINHHRMAL